MSTDTNTLGYWLNWRFFLCAIWVLTAMIGAATVVWKYEGPKKDKTHRRDDDQQDAVGILYKDEAWRTCSKAIHPAWLLAYRIIAFVVLMGLLLVDMVIHGRGLLYFYTQWTFTLVTLYFGVGSLFSIYGCFYCRDEVVGGRVRCVGSDTERGTYMAAAVEENSNHSDIPVNLISQDKEHVRKTAAIWGYIFQIIYQMCAGAVLLTDSVFWFVIYPFLTGKYYKLNFLIVSMHSLNAVFLFGDIALNYLRFPLFRIAYFIEWTCIFVLFQWIVHACISMWWPYSFLDLSSSYAPIWYLAVGLFHLPCYGIIVLLVRTKEVCLSRIS